MGKKICVLLLTVLMLVLSGCGSKEKVTYYETKSYTQQSTGDITRRENTYDENWNLLLQQSTLNGEFASKVEYEYSEDFTILTAKNTSAIYGTETSKVIRSFDEKGQVIKAESYEGERHIGTTEYTYDDRGEKVFIKTTHPESDTVITIERIFDEKGNLIRYIQDTGYYVSRYEYTCDKKGHRIREEHYQDDEMTGWTEFTWEGNVGTGTHYKPDGTPTGKQILEYDDHGNLLRLESQDLRGTTQTVLCYEYIGNDGSISGRIPE